MTVQRGILDPNQAHILLITFDLVDKNAADERLEAFWSDVTERLHDFYAHAGLTVTVGFGITVFDKLGKQSAMPKGLRLMPTWERDAFQPQDKQADMLLQIACNDRGVLQTVERDIRRYLLPAFEVRDYEPGFAMPNSRGQLGFVDGTGNPHDLDAKLETAFIAGGSHADGSFMVFRKIVEDLDAWDALPVSQQEKAIGRRKLDSAPYDPPDSTPATSHRSKSSGSGAHGEIEMLRRSYPFAGKDASGLLFICFVADLDQFEVIKTQMASPKNIDGSTPGQDAIHMFSTPVSGGYYYIPPVPDEGHIASFLFD